MQWTSNIYMSKMQRCNIGLAAQPSYCITTECRAVSFPIPKAPTPPPPPKKGQGSIPSPMTDDKPI